MSTATQQHAPIFNNSAFSHISAHDYLGFQEDHHVDYKKVVNFLDFDKNDVSKIAGVSKNSVRYDEERIPKELKDRLNEIANICQLVAEFFEGDVGKTALWFKTENPFFGNVSPRDMIRFGRYNILRQFILDGKGDTSLVNEKEG